MTGQSLPFDKLHVAPIAGLAGVKEVAITIPHALPAWKFLEGVTLKLAVVVATASRSAGWIWMTGWMRVRVATELVMLPNALATMTR